DLARLPLGSNLERLVRRAPVPVLAVSRSFRPIERMLLALDVDAESVSSVEALASGLLPARPLQLLHVGEQSERAQAALERASLQLGNSGFAVTASIVDGEPRHVIPEQVVLGSADLLAIGGFGGSWLKSLVLGSLTAELVRACQVP